MTLNPNLVRFISVDIDVCHPTSDNAQASGAYIGYLYHLKTSVYHCGFNSPILKSVFRHAHSIRSRID